MSRTPLTDHHQQSPAAPQHTSGVTIREMTAADYDRVGELTARAYLQGGHLQEGDRYLHTLADGAARLEWGRILVAETTDENGEPVVIGSVGICHPGKGEVAHDDEVEFRMLAVDPNYHRRGAARALLSAVLAHAQQQPGINAVVLTTMETMKDAHRLYRSAGFVHVPERDWWLSSLDVMGPEEEDQLFPVYRLDLTH